MRRPQSLRRSHSWRYECLSRSERRRRRRAERLRGHHRWGSQLVQRVHVVERLLRMAEEAERRLQHGVRA